MNKLKYFLFATVLIFTGCSKEGDPGPAGPKGEQGPEGEQGAEGEQGPKGTANVMYSEWLKPEWYISSSKYWIWYVNDENITKEVSNQGMVLVYYARANEVRKTSQPISQGLGNISFKVLFQSYIGSSGSYSLFLGASATDASDLESMKTNYVFRYVLVPGSVLTAGRIRGIDYSNYEEIKTYYNIPD